MAVARVSTRVDPEICAEEIATDAASALTANALTAAVVEASGSLNVRVSVKPSAERALLTRVGPAVSITIALLAAIEPAAAGVGRFKLASFPVAFLSDPPFRAKAEVDT